MRIFCQNMPWGAGEVDIRLLFEQYGKVDKVALCTFPESGERRSFIFVEMADADALRAIISLDGKEFRGRRLTVAKAFPRTEPRY
jgi:RNA recognition motif-containing protein